MSQVVQIWIEKSILFKCVMLLIDTNRLFKNGRLKLLNYCNLGRVNVYFLIITLDWESNEQYIIWIIFWNKKKKKRDKAIHFISKQYVTPVSKTWVSPHCKYAERTDANNSRAILLRFYLVVYQSPLHVPDVWLWNQIKFIVIHF